MNKFLSCLFALGITSCILGQTRGPKPTAIASQNTSNTGNKYAIVIGVSKYTDSTEFPNLNYADIDAKNFINFLKKGYVPNLDISKIKYLVNDKAIEDSIIEYLRWVTTNPDFKEGDELYVYFSGHGILEPKDNILIWHDTKMVTRGLTKLANTITGIQNIRDILSGLAYSGKLKVYFIVDACRNRIENNMTPQQENDLVQLLQKNLNFGEIDFYATEIKGFSYETEKLNGSGVFTYFLMLGLEGAADRDGNLMIDGQELNIYLNTTVSDYVKYVLDTLYEQTPNFFPTDNLSKVTITDMRRFKDIYQRAAIKKDSMQTIIENARQDFLRRHNTRRFLDKNKNEFLKKELNYGYEVIFTKNVTSTYFNDDDTLKNITYQNFSNALLHHELVRPEGKSAYDYFLLLKKDKDPNTDAAENKLFYALYDAIKDFLNAYLAGALIDAKKKDFEVAYEETSKLISFLDKNDFLLKSLQTKLYFFRAQIFAFSNDPNDWTTGVNLIDSALNMEKTAFSYLTKAILFSNKSQFFTAIKYLDTALIYAPNWKFALYNLATTNYKIQEFGKSIDYCKRVLKIDSNYSRMYSWLAYNYETIGDNSLRRANYEKAVYYNQKALEKDSTNSYAYLNLGRIYSKLPGNYYENLQTSKYYYRIGGLKYGDYHCLTMLGSCFINSLTHRADSAEYFYKLALKANPFDTSALIKYAYLFFLSGRRNSADSLFFSVLNYTKLDYKFLSKYRSYLFDFKSAAKADEIFAETIQRNSQDPSIFIQHSEDYESIDSLYKAKNILSLGMSYIDSSPSLNLAMASLFFNHIISSNFYKNALDSSKYYLDKVRFMSPTYSLVYSNLGTYFAIKRNNDSAIFYYKKADSLNGFVSSANNFDRYLSTLADFSLKKGNYSDAKKYYTMSDQVVAQTAFVGGNIADRKSLSAYNLARYYYINNRLKLAKKFCNRSINYFSRYYQSDDSESDSTIVVDSSFLNRQDELLALIEFEYKKRNNYKKSRKIFGDVFERSNDYLYYLEKAICNYKLGEKHKIEKAHMLRENSLEVYERITQQKRVNYSDYFIEQLNDFINYMDTSARSWQDIGKSAIPKSSLFSNNISFNSFVIKYGFTYSKLGTELPSKRFAPGRFYALAYELPLTKRFGIEPEVQLTPIPADSALKGNTFRNLSFPFLFTYRVNSFLYLNAGPQISFLLNRGSLKDSVENLRTIATFLNIGLTIKYRNLRIYSRYLSNIGRLNIADRPKNWNLRQLSFGIGLQLF